VILLDHQNNYVGNSSMTSCKKFSAKPFFPCKHAVWDLESFHLNRHKISIRKEHDNYAYFRFNGRLR